MSFPNIPILHRRYVLLDWLRHNNNHTISAMADAMDCTSGTISTYLLNLEREGLIKREHLHRHSAIIKITKAGMEYFVDYSLPQCKRTERKPRQHKPREPKYQRIGGTVEERMRAIEARAIANGTHCRYATLAPAA